MQLGALTRLRLSFLALGVLVLGPLCWVLASVEARLDAQRRLRHEVVADRIFDELERELTSVLAKSAQQPRLLSGRAPPVESWPPFVVGYINRTNRGNQLFTRTPHDPSGAARLHLAVNGIVTKVGPLALPALSPDTLGLAAPKADAMPVPPSGTVSHIDSFSGPEPAPAARMKPGVASQLDVLKNLNRANEQRQQDLGYR
jgi:hypothetical protein